MPYLEQAMTSALDQLTPEMEVIVRDNCSTDGTVAFLTSLDDPRIRVAHAPTPVSAGENWTAVCTLATGTYTKVLCADDTLLPGGLSRQLDAAIHHPGAVLVASRRQVIDDRGTVVICRHGLSRLIGEFNGDEAMTTAVLAGHNPIGEPSSVLFRTDALLASLPFTEDFPYLTDLDMYVKVLHHGSFVGLATLDATFRLSSGSWSQSIARSQYREYRGWLSSLISRGTITLPRRKRAALEWRILMRFLGRRMVILLTPLLSALHRN
jgi:glycosyltransferase involved in cell wall biosynthesis